MEQSAAPLTEIGRTVGRQIKRLREARRMSVSELARQTGISKATLSVVESGQGNPTIETIAAIAVGLRLPLADLVAPNPPEAAVQRGTAPPAESKQELLTRIGAGRAIEVWRLRIADEGRRIESPAHVAGTIEYILVSRGPILVGDATDPKLLDAGDFIVFPADIPHLYQACADDVEAVVTMSLPSN